jgi:hypothetical protein
MNGQKLLISNGKTELNRSKIGDFIKLNIKYQNVLQSNGDEPALYPGLKRRKRRTIKKK